MPICLLRISRISAGPSGTRSRSCHRMRPAVIRPGGIAISFNVDSAVTVLPQPDSPTTPNVSPRATVRSTPSTARTVPSSVWNSVRKPWISSKGGAAGPVNSQHRARVEPIAQPIADKIDRQHGQKDRRAREQRPVRRDVEIILGVKEDATPGRDIGGEAKTEKRQRRFGDDRDRDIDGPGDD